MKQIMNESLANLTQKIIEPLIEVFLFFGVDYNFLNTIIKKTYISIALRDYGKRSRQTSISRISIMTGLTRKEVSSIKKLLGTQTSDDLKINKNIDKIIKIWTGNKDYLTTTGKPKKIKLESGKISFINLVKIARTDIPAKAITTELQRLNLIEIDSKNYMHLLTNEPLCNSKKNDLALRLQDLQVS